MRRWLRRAIVVTFAGVAIGGGPVKAGTSDRYYTAAQARAGARVYAVNCGRCHGVELHGGSGPALVGPGIARRWLVRTLYAFVSRQMPADARGRLRPAEYAAVVAFLLSRSGHPPGVRPLTAARARRIGAML